MRSEDHKAEDGAVHCAKPSAGAVRILAVAFAPNASPFFKHQSMQRNSPIKTNAPIV